MKTMIGLALLGVSLAGCGSDQPAPAQATEGALDAGTTSADLSPTLEGSGDLSSAAGAGADTGAMDGGRAGADGTPTAVDQGEGGPDDAMSGKK